MIAIAMAAIHMTKANMIEKQIRPYCTSPFVPLYDIEMAAASLALCRNPHCINVNEAVLLTTLIVNSQIEDILTCIGTLIRFPASLKFVNSQISFLRDEMGTAG